MFKIITTDNGSEFSRLSELEELSETLVFIHIHIRHVKKVLMNVIMALYKDLFQKVNVSVTLM